MSQTWLMQRRFSQVDVFTDVPYRGNALAVVIDGDGLSDAEMQQFANWTNLSETTFLCAPTNSAADYKVRIFTASSELPFAGHPTLGSCHAWLRAGGKPKSPDHVVQECGVGLVRVKPVDDLLAFAAPPLLRGGDVDADTLAEVAAQLQMSPTEILAVEWIDNGPGWIGALLASAEAVLAVQSRPTGTLKIGVAGLYPPGSPHAIEVRAFFPSRGIVSEDPVTGSLNASLAQWLLRSGRIHAPYVAAQGTVLGRAGRIHVHVDAQDVWVGGHSVTCIDGSVTL